MSRKNTGMAYKMMVIANSIPGECDLCHAMFLLVSSTLTYFQGLITEPLRWIDATKLHS
jgi:hypothetical protein